MKTRILVMNKQRLVQQEATPGDWKTTALDSAGLLKAGVYNVYRATPADKASVYAGVVIHSDKDAVYQQVGRDFVRHPREFFDKLPEIGSTRSISYDSRTGRAAAAEVSLAAKNTVKL